MNNEFIEMHKRLAVQALYRFYRKRYASIEVAVEGVVNECVPEVGKNTTFRQIMIARQHLIIETLEWAKNDDIQNIAKKEVEEYHKIVHVPNPQAVVDC